MPLQATEYRSHPNRNCIDDKQNTCNESMDSHIAKDQPLSILSLEKETTNRNVMYLDNEINSSQVKMPKVLKNGRGIRPEVRLKAGHWKIAPGAAHLGHPVKHVPRLARARLGADSPDKNAEAFSSGNGLTNGLF